MSEPLLSVRDLAKHFIGHRSLLGTAKAHVRAVDGVSFDVIGRVKLCLVVLSC